MDTPAMHDGQLPAQIARTLTAACREAGIDPDGARLLHMHSNTVFYLPAARAVARIASSAEAAGRIAASLAVTEWLAKRDFPTVHPKTLKAVELEDLVVSAASREVVYEKPPAIYFYFRRKSPQLSILSLQ